VARTAEADTAAVSVELESLHPLVAALVADGYRVVGPIARNDAIVLAEIDSADALPYGWGVTVEPGIYRLHRRDDSAAFGHVASQQSWKKYLQEAHTRLWAVDRTDGAGGGSGAAEGGTAGGWTITSGRPEAPRYAFVGVRACDLQAIGVQDRVLGGVDTGYASRREPAFIVAVSCTEPGSTCFCASTGHGPQVGPGYDVALTELIDGSRVRYVADAGTSAGQRLLAGITTRPAGPDLVERARAEVRAAAGRMVRSLPEVDLRVMLAAAREAARWDDVAARCLSCGNCTMACPTCFCTTVEDVTDLAGTHAERWLRWDSCFDVDYSYLLCGPVRISRRGRYRQWCIHKIGTWYDQFGEIGCVGCGRCIVWCPVGIDITEEAHALAAECAAGAGAGAGAPGGATGAAARPGGES
jgi:ferredoxin